MFKRVLILLVSSAAVVSWGCSQSYTTRMESTLSRMKEQKEYDQNLSEAVTDGPFQETKVFFRAPKPLAIAKDFLLAAPQPLQGKFEILASYYDGSGGEGAKPTVHLFARTKNPKLPTPKKGQPAPQPVPRGPFVDEVRTIVAQAQPPSDPSKFDATPKAVTSPRSLQRIAYESTANNDVEIDFFKRGDTDVAIVYIDPKGKKDAKKNNLSLKNFAMGAAATRRFQGDVSADEDSVDAGGDAASSGF